MGEGNKQPHPSLLEENVLRFLKCEFAIPLLALLWHEAISSRAHGLVGTGLLFPHSVVHSRGAHCSPASQDPQQLTGALTYIVFLQGLGDELHFRNRGLGIIW